VAPRFLKWRKEAGKKVELLEVEPSAVGELQGSSGVMP